MRYIKLDESNKITSIRYAKTIVDGEIESEQGELGQIMQQDGSFVDDITPIETVETLEDKVNNLTQQNLILMDAIATMYEDMIIKGVL